MKYVKVLGLAATAAMALMAFGAGTASATMLYSTGVTLPAGTQVHATMTGTFHVTTTDEKTLMTTCTSGTIVGSLAYPGGGSPVINISGKTWGGCTSTTDTLTNGSLSISSSGTVTGSSTVITKNFGGVSCRYGYGGGTHLGTLGTGSLSINAVINEQEPKSFICPDTTRWVATYIITSPHDLTAGP